jgi:predicted branched-subunit amino acid permease
MIEAEADGPFDAAEIPLAELPRARRVWYLRGLRRVISVPAAALAGGYVGFGALVHDFGWPLWLAMLSVPVIFANPAQVVLAGALAAGAGIAAACFAVTLSAVRLLPMVVGVLPLLRWDRGSRAGLVLAAHVTAITTWVEMLRLLPAVPRPVRLSFYVGLGTGLIAAGTIATGIGFLLAASLPPVLGIGLLAITPLYFLLSLERGARSPGERISVLFGLAIAPLAFAVAPGFELLIAGLLGGTLAFAADRLRRRAGRAR